MRYSIKLIPGIIAVVLAMIVSFVLKDARIVTVLSLITGMLALIVTLGYVLLKKEILWKKVISIFIPVILFISVALSHLPLRLVFRIYRAEFDNAASQIETGTPPTMPFWIGPFKIEMTGRKSADTIYLATNNTKYEIDGFAKSPNGAGFNLWSCIRLDDTWSYVKED